MGSRLFVAVELPEAARSTLADFGGSKRRHTNPQNQIHWTSPGLYHVTLKFIGDLDENRRTDLRSRLASVAENTNPFTVRLDHPGTFPAKGSPSVLWVGSSESNSNLTTLAASIDEHCVSLGISREIRPYAPHVTLARVKHAAMGQALRSLWTASPHPTAVTFKVHEIVLMDSRLSPGGARYKCLDRFALGKIS